MQVSSIMEEARGRHWEVRFSTNQRLCVAAGVLFGVGLLIEVIGLVVNLLAAMRPGFEGLVFGGELIVPDDIAWVLYWAGFAFFFAACVPHGVLRHRLRRERD